MSLTDLEYTRKKIIVLEEQLVRQAIEYEYKIAHTKAMLEKLHKTITDLLSRSSPNITIIKK